MADPHFPSEDLTREMLCPHCRAVTMFVLNGDGEYFCGCCFNGLLEVCEHRHVTHRRVIHR